MRLLFASGKWGQQMNAMIWLVVGGLLGWLSCVELGASRWTDRLLNVAAGACGALAAGLLLSRAFGSDFIHSSEFSVASLVEAAFGAIVLLVLVNLYRLTRVP